MKSFKYLSLLLLLSIAYSCGGEGVDSKLMWTGTIDVSDFTMYVGTPDGGKPVVFPTDSALVANMKKYMQGGYNERVYASFSVEFNDDMITYLDPTTSRQTVSTYTYQGDSLFVVMADKSLRFVACGTKEELYKIKGVFGYRSVAVSGGISERVDTLISRDGTVPLDTVFKYSPYSSLEDMKTVKDTIMLCNIKYVFN